MKIKKNAIFKVSDQERYLILENTNYNFRDYYLAIPLDSHGCPQRDDKRILYVESEYELDPEKGFDLGDKKEKICILERKDEREELLMMLFEEQMKMEGRGSDPRGV